MTYRSVENIKIGKNSFGQNRDNATFKVNFSFYYIWFLYPFKSNIGKLKKVILKELKYLLKNKTLKSYIPLDFILLDPCMFM